MKFDINKLTITWMGLEKLVSEDELQKAANTMTDNAGYLFRQQTGDLIMRNRRYGRNKRYPYRTSSPEIFIRKIKATK